MKVNFHAGETGFYELEGKVGPSPDITVQIGKTYVFNQHDPTNWYHPVRFAYYPDGAHGDTWGGAERDEVEGAGELLYKINGVKIRPPCGTLSVRPQCGMLAVSPAIAWQAVL